MKEMDNYAKSRENARAYFCRYVQEHPVCQPLAPLEQGAYCFPFLGARTRVRQSDGEALFSWPYDPEWIGDFSETLSVYDWLTHDPDAKTAGEYCPVHALPGVLVRGGNLVMRDAGLSAEADRDPEHFSCACLALGGQRMELGDLTYRIPLFPRLDMLLKFYRGDEEFPPSMTFLWDRNVLRFLRYETVFYVARCLVTRLQRLMDVPQEELCIFGSAGA